MPSEGGGIFAQSGRYLATHETYVVINGEEVNKVEFDYVYNTSKNNYITQYGSYLSYFGLDTSKDLSTQMYSETLTWKDYFEQNAVESLKQNKALMAEAKAAGFTYDTTDEYNTFKETIKTSAAAAGVSDKEYVRSIYGSYATMGRIEEYVKNDMVMNAYYQKLQEDNAPGDDEIQSYYEENKATYDSVDYRLTTIEADLPTEPTELADPVEETAATTDTTATDGTAATDATASDSTDTAYQPSDAEIAKAMEDAKVLADDAEQTVAKDGEAHENEKKSSVNYLISDWLFDDARKAGDTTVITNDNSHCYYVVAFGLLSLMCYSFNRNSTRDQFPPRFLEGAASKDIFRLRKTSSHSRVLRRLLPRSAPHRQPVPWHLPWPWRSQHRKAGKRYRCCRKLLHL